MPENPQVSGCFLGFDFGFRRIGIAVGRSETGTASALHTISNKASPDWQRIERLVDEWKPAGFVIGLPLDPEGAETKMSQAARGFGRALEKRFERPSFYFDERLSSHGAAERFVQMRSSGLARRKDASKLDAMAAQIIVENWLQFIKPVNHRSGPENDPGDDAS